MANHHGLLAAIRVQGPYNHIGICLEGRRWIVARQVDGDDSMAACLKFWGHTLPAPGACPGPVDQGDGRHDLRSLSVERIEGSWVIWPDGRCGPQP